MAERAGLSKLTKNAGKYIMGCFKSRDPAKRDFHEEFDQDTGDFSFKYWKTKYFFRFLSEKDKVFFSIEAKPSYPRRSEESLINEELSDAQSDSNNIFTDYNLQIDEKGNMVFKCRVKGAPDDTRDLFSSLLEQIIKPIIRGVNKEE